MAAVKKGNKIGLCIWLTIIFVWIGMVYADNAVLIKCLDFQDHTGDGTTLTIPSNLSSRKELEHEPLRFTLKIGFLSCPEKIAFTKHVWWNEGKPPSDTTWFRSFDIVPNARKNLPRHFTPNGYFYDIDKFYYSPQDYCVKTLLRSRIEILTCPHACKDLNKTEHAICFPKCCAIDEAIDFWSGNCTKLSLTKSSVDYWEPEIYKEGSGWYQHPKRVLPGYKNQIQFKLATFPENCSVRPATAMARSEYENETDSQEEEEHPVFDFVSSKTVDDHPENPPYVKKDVRLALHNGKITRLVLDDVKRQWILEKNEFCADSFITDANPRIKSDAFVIYACEPPMVEMTSEAEWRTWFYIVVSLFSILFMLVTVVIYFLVFNKLNIHGLTILVFSLNSLLAYILLTCAHFIFLYDTEVEGRSTKSGILERKGFCYFIAITGHFFTLSYYFWLTIMNLDLWLTFRTMRVVRRESKDWKKFGVYSLIAFGIPLLMVIAFAIVNEKYKDPITLVPIPDYAFTTCAISPEFRGYYYFLPVAIIIGLNIIIIIPTLKIFVDARRQTKAVLGADNGPSASKKYSAKLFVKLFFITGGVSLIEYVSWFYLPHQEKKPWVIVILECLTYLAPVILFFLFCLNERMLGLLQERFPGLRDCLAPMRDIFRRTETANETSITNTDASKERFEMKRQNESSSSDSNGGP